MYEREKKDVDFFVSVLIRQYYHLPEFWEGAWSEIYFYFLLDAPHYRTTMLFVSNLYFRRKFSFTVNSEENNLKIHFKVSLIFIFTKFPKVKAHVNAEKNVYIF